MEVKINREIRNYTESMFFGLSMRQFVFSVLAILVAVGLYFLLKPHFGTETVSWMCILGAAPFAALGFITYHTATLIDNQENSLLSTPCVAERSDSISNEILSRMGARLPIVIKE